MNAAQLQLGSAPAAIDAERVAASGLSADDRRECRGSAVTTSEQRPRVDDGNRPRGGEPRQSANSARLTTGARVIFDHMDARQRSVGEIASGAGFHPAAVRRHLEALAAAELVTQEAGKWRRA